MLGHAVIFEGVEETLKPMDLCLKILRPMTCLAEINLSL